MDNLSDGRDLIIVKDVVLRYPMINMAPQSLKETILAPGKSKYHNAKYYESLRGVSFTVKKGERLGIIGRNGAGKSSLLKALAGIYPIQGGEIVVHGEVNSLFDLNVGFEVEESGRSNIYHRGYLLGYDRKDIQKLESEIISFAGLEEFIDMPLKTYSAGMQVRLAFSILTAMGEGVLLLDEILTAGDAEFTTKARKRMEEMIAEASCMVYVSHDLEVVKRICTRVIWIDSGLIRCEGDAESVIHEFLMDIERGGRPV